MTMLYILSQRTKITFAVILETLVFQGLTLPLFIKWFRIEEMDEYIPEEEQIQRSVSVTEATADHKEKKEKLVTVRKLYRKIMLDLISLRRDGLNRLRRDKKYDDEDIRIIENNLDLEEARLRKY